MPSTHEPSKDRTTELKALNGRSDAYAIDLLADQLVKLAADLHDVTARLDALATDVDGLKVRVREDEA
jgi:hypothetical protein